LLFGEELEKHIASKQELALLPVSYSIAFAMYRRRDLSSLIFVV